MRGRHTRCCCNSTHRKHIQTALGKGYGTQMFTNRARKMDNERKGEQLSLSLVIPSGLSLRQHHKIFQIHLSKPKL